MKTWSALIMAIITSTSPLLATTSETDIALTIRFVGNAGVELSDGQTTLLVDLPYEPGYLGYMSYDLSDIMPRGRTVCLITHRHRDHFRPAWFHGKDWEIVGPKEVTDELPEERVIALEDTVTVGAFSIVPSRTPHGDTEHYSHLVVWNSSEGGTLRFFFVGDTEDPANLFSQKDLDIAFVTSWLGCAASREGGSIDAERVVLYHHWPQPDRDQLCIPMERPQRGDVLLSVTRDGAVNGQ